MEQDGDEEEDEDDDSQSVKVFYCHMFFITQGHSEQ